MLEILEIEETTVLNKEYNQYIFTELELNKILNLKDFIQQDEAFNESIQCKFEQKLKSDVLESGIHYSIQDDVDNPIYIEHLLVELHELGIINLYEKYEIDEINNIYNFVEFDN